MDRHFFIEKRFDVISETAMIPFCSSHSIFTSQSDLIITILCHGLTFRCAQFVDVYSIFQFIKTRCLYGLFSGIDNLY